MEDLKFEEAFQALKQGRKIARMGWNGRGQFVAMQVPDSGSKNTLPYCWIYTTMGARVPWTPSQTDLFAEDWLVVE